MNEKITGTTLQQWASDLDLYEYVTQQHSDSTATFNNGSVSIDGIFLSQAIQVTQGGTYHLVT